MSTDVFVRLPDAIAKKFGLVAKKNERSRSFVVTKAIESYLDDFADLQVALDIPALSGQFVCMRKYRVGDYRMIFVVIDGCVLILRIQNRKGIYPATLFRAETVQSAVSAGQNRFNRTKLCEHTARSGKTILACNNGAISCFCRRSVRYAG